LRQKNIILIALLFGEGPQQTEHIGCIEIDCDPKLVVRDAYENARWLCDQYYYGAPEIVVKEHNGMNLESVPYHLVSN
jgi:pyruvate dehydrogenase kinase 2/3/4